MRNVERPPKNNSKLFHHMDDENEMTNDAKLDVSCVPLSVITMYCISLFIILLVHSIMYIVYQFPFLFFNGSGVFGRFRRKTAKIYTYIAKYVLHELHMD